MSEAIVIDHANFFWSQARNLARQIVRDMVRMLDWHSRTGSVSS